ncbi:hypothetical protein [Pseudoalteromonas piscicida]|uniref:Uncharacterized protein n=1 Tax=Pseudoalteromonas piscicida TaxID=43662 RepID=A0A2A5JVC1_PSEO7|nr:hypothetical protein [Pseudoalteromonas piscicida]PCK33424.1 hypothetical protein CEX98_01475 [Pseudoalteromonas piscicida]
MRHTRLLLILFYIVTYATTAQANTVKDREPTKLPTGIWVGLSNHINKEVTALRISKQGPHGFIHASILSTLSNVVSYKFTDKDIDCDKYFCHINMVDDKNNSISLRTFLDPVWNTIKVTELDPDGYSDTPTVQAYELHRVENLAILDTYIKNIRKRQPLISQSEFAGNWVGYTKNENLAVTNDYLVNLYIREDGHAELESYLLRSITSIARSEFSITHQQHDDKYIDIEVESLAGLCLGAAKLTLSKVTNDSINGYYRCLHHRHKTMLNEGLVELYRNNTQ